MLTESNRALQLSVQSLFSSMFPTDLLGSRIARFWTHGERENNGRPWQEYLKQ